MAVLEADAAACLNKKHERFFLISVLETKEVLLFSTESVVKNSYIQVKFESFLTISQEVIRRRMKGLPVVLVFLFLAEVSWSQEQEAQEPNTIHYSTPVLDVKDHPHFYYESFDDEIAFNQRWTKSKATKADESGELKYDGEWNLVASHSKLQGDGALVLTTRAQHHAIASKISDTVNTKDGLVLQYEVQFRNGQECGGAYIKLLAAPSGQLAHVNDKTQYSIMFGPDKCGNDYKLHFIFMHKNPKNGTLREIHWKKAHTVNKLEDAVKDGKWHLFRLTIGNDNSFEVMFDKKVVGQGSLLEDFLPAVNPPKEIEDPNDSKPEDWDEREKIPDPDARKPEDWDENEPRKIADVTAVKPSDWDENEPEMIPDPEAVKPSDWDPDMDGDWQPASIPNPKCASISGCGLWKAPLIDNPKFKGKWKPNLISNPNFKGRWSPRKIKNPDFFEDLKPYIMLPIDAVAFELWTISDGIAFDNILLTSEPSVADYVLDHTFQIKKELADEETDPLFIRLIKYTNKKPWLWAVYVLAISIPVVLFIAYCCIEPVRKKEDEELIHRKKTDEAPPSSRGVSITEVVEEEDEDGRASPQEEYEDDGEVGEEDAQEEDQEEVNDEEEEEENKTSTRQRKTRSRRE